MISPAMTMPLDRLGENGWARSGRVFARSSIESAFDMVSVFAFGSEFARKRPECGNLEELERAERLLRAHSGKGQHISQ